MSNTEKMVVSDEMRKYIESRYYDTSPTELAEETGINRNTISGIWYRAGLTGKQHRKYHIRNEEYFNCIDSPEKAYFAGFIAADGCICQAHEGERQDAIRITIHKQDEHILELFRKELDTKKPITHQGGRYSIFEVTSNMMSEALRNIGIGYRKTYSKIEPKIPRKYERDYIRGYFDGDGSIHLHYPLSKTNVCIVGYSGNLEWIRRKLSEVNIQSGIVLDKRDYNDGNGEFGELQMPNTISKYSFLRYMYDGSGYCCLKRKYDKAMRFEERVENSSSNMDFYAVKYYEYAVKGVMKW